jgi:hypothetical protein
VGAGLEPTGTGALRCRRRNRRYAVPGRTIIREVLVRVDPDALSRALQRRNLRRAEDEAVAIVGKTMCNAIGADDRRTHILGVVGRRSRACRTRKKSALRPSRAAARPSKPTQSGW